MSQNKSAGAAAAIVTPDQISDILIWWTAQDTTLFNSGSISNNDSVVTIDNKANPGTYPFTQTTATAEPVFKTAVSDGGKAGIYFDGLNDHMDNNIISDNQPHTWVVVCKPDASGSDNLFDGSGSGARQTLVEQAGDWRMFAGSAFDTGLSYGNSVQQELFAIFNSTSSYLRKNGTDSSTGDAGTSKCDVIYLGSNNSGSGNWFKGYVFEFILYSKELTSQEITDLEAYFDSEGW